MTIYTSKTIEILFGTEEKAKEVLTKPYRLIGNLTELLTELTALPFFPAFSLPFDTLVIHCSQLDLLLTDAAWLVDVVTIEVITDIIDFRTGLKSYLIEII